MTIYAGTIDRVAEIGGQHWILDLKTGRKNPRTHALQVAAYARAYTQQTGLDIEGGICVYLHPHRPVRAKTYSLLTWRGDKFAAWQSNWVATLSGLEYEGQPDHDIQAEWTDSVVAGTFKDELAFEESDHVYTLKGFPIPSVTTLIQDLVTKKPYTGDPSYGIRGTRIHQATELLDQNELDIESRQHPDYVDWLDSWELFKKEIKPSFLEIEARTWGWA